MMFKKMDADPVRSWTKKGKGILLCICIIYTAFQITRLLYPLRQFSIYLGNYTQTGEVSVFTYYDYGTEYVCTRTGSMYEADVMYDQTNYHMVFQVAADGNRIQDLRINEKEVSENKIYKLGDLTEYSLYDSIVVVTDHSYPVKFWICMMIILAVFALLWACIQFHGDFRRNCWWMYSDSGIRAIGKKAVFVSFAVCIGSVFIHYGCDIGVILGSLNIQHSGIDIYQLQSSMDTYIDQELVMWPYNLAMLVFYDIALFLNRFFLPFYSVAGYHLFPVLLVKIVNMGLINLTVLAVLSFLVDERVIEKKSAKSIYYWSVFNPATFWIAIVYIQLDVWPIYCITLGLLLLRPLRKTWMLSAILTAVGLCTKAQAILIAPAFLAACITIFFINETVFAAYRERFVGLVKYLTVFLGTVILLLGIFYVKREAFYNVVTHIPQSDRAWWTVIAYAPSVFLYITLGGLILVFLFRVFRYHLGMGGRFLIIQGIYDCAVIVLVFSFGILSTPGTYLNCLSAFVLLYAFSKDHYQRLIYAAGSILIVSQEMFSSVGDISMTLTFFGREPVFTTLERILAGTDAGIKYTSVLFTIGHMAMLAYAVLFFQKSCREKDVI